MQQQIQKRIHKPANRWDRRGATLVESAICILGFLTLVFGMLDLGIGVLRYNTVAEAARLGARLAIVHGSKAPPELATWTAPDGVNDPTAAAAISAIISPLLNAEGVATGDITVTVVHTDGVDANSTTSDPAVTTAGDTVTVTVSFPYKPMMSFIFGSSTITLTGKSTMGIAH